MYAACMVSMSAWSVCACCRLQDKGSAAEALKTSICCAAAVRGGALVLLTAEHDAVLYL
jgi:hypothetical protein